jgi:hypothetical protein
MKNGWIDKFRLSPLKRKFHLLLMVMIGLMGASRAQAQTLGAERGFEFFSPFRAGYGFNSMEQFALISVLVVAKIGSLFQLAGAAPSPWSGFVGMRWPPPATSAWPPPPGTQLRRGHAVGLPHRHRSPAC